MSNNIEDYALLDILAQGRSVECNDEAEKVSNLLHKIADHYADKIAELNDLNKKHELLKADYEGLEERRFFQQLDEWFLSKVKTVKEYKDADNIELANETITDKKIISGFKLGLNVALITFGNSLPAAIYSEDE